MSNLETVCRAFGVIGPREKAGSDEELRSQVLTRAAAGDRLAADFVDSHQAYFVVKKKPPEESRLKMSAILPRPKVRNLIYHVCALRANDGWKDNVAQLRQRLGVFNGKRVVAIARGPGIHDPATVMRELPGCEYLVLPNCPVIREVATFLPLLLSVASTNPEECSFYAHTKSNSTADGQRGAWAWTKTMYHHLLDFPNEVMEDLRTNLAVGTTQAVWHGTNPPFPSGLRWCGWAFYGTFWWFRHDAVFGIEDWMKFPNDRYTAESWLGHLLPPERCKSRFQPWPLTQYPSPSPYQESLYPVLPEAPRVVTEPLRAVANLPTLNHRDQFPELIDALGIKTAAEIGVAAGGFARVLLRSKIEKLYLIDPWPNPADHDYRRQTYELAAEYPGRVEIIEEPSLQAVKRFAPGSVGFVYLDPMHEYEHVKADIPPWWEVASRVLAGHDYVPWNTVVGCPAGVIPAVEEFAEAKNLTVQVTGAGPSRADRLLAAWRATEKTPEPWGAHFPSWWILK